MNWRSYFTMESETATSMVVLENDIGYGWCVLTLCKGI